jgi:hypothetical protein
MSILFNQLLAGVGISESGVDLAAYSNHHFVLNAGQREGYSQRDGIELLRFYSSSQFTYYKTLTQCFHPK